MAIKSPTKNVQMYIMITTSHRVQWSLCIRCRMVHHVLVLTKEAHGLTDCFRLLASAPKRSCPEPGINVNKMPMRSDAQLAL